MHSEKKLRNCKVIKNYPLRSTNRIRTGGSAQYYARVATIDQLQEILLCCRKEKLPFYILGKGSNVLISDEKFDGVVIKLGGDFTYITFNESTQTVTAGAGVSLIKLGVQLARRGYVGYAYMGVIPGSVGGAVRMNAGIAQEAEIKNNFHKALILDPETGDIHEYQRDAMLFAYRKSALSASRKIIIQATFQLTEQKEAFHNEALNSVKDLLKQRRLRQPASSRTFGSTFRNPENSTQSAGWYLEKAGMKGMRIGDALVAQEHANWIINTNNARSSQIRQLIEMGQRRVFETFGIRLEREVVYLPEDMETWSNKMV